MKVLLVMPPGRGPSVIPLGMGYVASYLQREGHELEVLDLTAMPLSDEEIRCRIKNFGKYDCIGISAIITAYDFVKKFSKEIKLYFPNLPIVVGNAISAACPETLLKYSDIDIVVIDEGELTMAEIVKNIKNLNEFRNIKGICYKENKSIYRTEPRERIENLDLLPFPAWDLFDVHTYMDNAEFFLERGLKTGWLSAVRGCPYNCGYCSRSFGPKITFRSAGNLIDEVLELKRRFDVNHISIIDDLFFANKKLITGFSNMLIEKNIKISWSSSGRVNLVDEKILELAKRSGCIRISYGLESGSQKILDNMNKCATVAQARNAIRLTRKAGIDGTGSLMFGYIGETRETIKETFDFIQEMKLDTRRFFFSTPYPKTPLYEWARKHNRIKEDEDTYLSNLGNNAEICMVNLTDFSKDELIGLKNETEDLLTRSMPLSVRVNYIRSRVNYMKGRIKSFGIGWAFRKIFQRVAKLFKKVDENNQ